jgi:F-type H+-transporting ATPase subunit b
MASTASVALFLAAEEGEPSPLTPHLSELIVGLVAFTLLFLFLRAKVFPMFEKAYADRSAAIEGGIERAEKAQAEAAASLEQYKAQLADAQAEAARIREQARAEGQQILDELRTQAQTESERIRVRGEEQLRGERQQVVAQLRGEIGRLAVDLAERIVGEHLDEQTRSRTVDRFLAELESDTGSATPVGQDA